MFLCTMCNVVNIKPLVGGEGSVLTLGSLNERELNINLYLSNIKNVV